MAKFEDSKGVVIEVGDTVRITQELIVDTVQDMMEGGGATLQTIQYRDGAEVRIIKCSDVEMIKKASP